MLASVMLKLHMSESLLDASIAATRTFGGKDCLPDIEVESGLLDAMVSVLLRRNFRYSKKHHCQHAGAVIIVGMIFLLSDAITSAAEQYPDQDAIVCRKEKLTYGQLEQRSNQLARVLMEEGVRRGDRVGIYLDKSLESAIAIYGIMKAGAAYVPLDPSAPLARLHYVTQDCGIRYLVSAPNKRRGLAPLLAEHGNSIQCVIGAPPLDGVRARLIPWKKVNLATSQPLDRSALDTDLAYIMYTSGSTGEPKGIMHTHASGLSYAKWAHDVYQLRQDDRLANHAPLHFDLSTFDFFAGALAGATTVIVGDEYLQLPASYSQLLQDEKITTFFTVPHYLTQLLSRGMLDQRELSSLRWVLFGGETHAPKASHRFDGSPATHALQQHLWSS